MEDPKGNEQPNAQDMQDFGMEEQEEQQPKINNYQTTKPATSEPNTPNVPAQNKAEESKVDPTGPPPPVTPDKPATPVVTKTNIAGAKQPQPAMQHSQQPGQANQLGQKPGTPPKKPVNPAAKKKALFGCLGIFGFMVIIFLVFAFIIVAQAGTGDNPIARLLNINEATFVNGLITLINIVFLIIGLLTVIFAIGGLVKVATAKKDDKETKKAGIKRATISGIAFFLTFIIWIFVFFWLDPKRVIIEEAEALPEIQTEPEQTLNLTAPIEIRFDASSVRTSNQFQILSYRWDFGDGTTGTNQIVTHTYRDKGTDGRFDVLLTVTRRDKETGEEFQDQYSTIVTIANEALAASFTADPESGAAPLEVTFDASDSNDPDGEIDRYEWDLDDDGEYDDDTGVTVEYEFERIGTYNVGLRVVSTTGESATTEKEIVVEEKEEPEAVITVTNEPDVYLTGQSYIFRADDSFSPKGDIVEYEWDFGDGSATQSTKTVSHKFAEEGNYIITLIVTDEEGNEGDTSLTVSIGSPQGEPKAVIESEPALNGSLSLNGTVPFTVVFDASNSTDSDNNIVDYEWDFDGNGTPDGYGALSSHTFNNPGTFTVNLRVIDSDNNTDTATMVVQVEEQGITAAISADKIEGSVPLTVNFDASGSSYTNGTIVSYQWDFGDGTQPRNGIAQMTKRYTSIGSYTAKVTAIGSDGSQDSAEILITVREIPLSACFTAVRDEGPAPFTTTFDPGCSTGTVSSYKWDFGDGATSTQLTPTHTFDNPGQYPVVLEVIDSDNTVSTSELIITVN